MGHELGCPLCDARRERRLMTRQAILKMPAIATPAPPWREIPQFDERLWKAWVEKNEQQDK